MLGLHPFLRERLAALGVFSGIAVAGVAGVELVISGALDPITPRFVSGAPSEYTQQRVMEAWHYDPYEPAPAYVTPTDNYLGYPLDGYSVEYPARQELAGGAGDASIPDSAPAASTNDFELYEEIERLYRDPEQLVEDVAVEPAAEDVRAPVESDQVAPPEPLPDYIQEEAPLADDAPREAEEVEEPGLDLSAYGNASP